MNNPNSTTVLPKRCPMQFWSVACFMGTFFFGVSGIILTAIAPSGIRTIGILFLALAMVLACIGIFLRVRMKQHVEYVSQTAGGTRQMPVVTGLLPPGNYEDVQPVPQPGNQATTPGPPYSGAYPPSTAGPPFQTSQSVQPVPQPGNQATTPGPPYSGTYPPSTVGPPYQTSQGTPYPPQSQPYDTGMSAPPPSYEAAVSVMGVQPSAPPEEK